MSPPDRRRDALSIHALVDPPQPQRPPHTRQCGKCQATNTTCDGRDPCRNCESRGTNCGYAWSSSSTSPPPAYVPRLPVSPSSKRPPPPPADTGWVVVPAGTNAPAVTRGGEPGPPIKPCKTCQARNTTCDGVLPVCGSCRTRRLECYIATPAQANERPRSQSLWPDHPRIPIAHASSVRPDLNPSRTSLSFMLNPTSSLAASQPVASSSRPRPLDLKRSTHAQAPTALVTPATPVAFDRLERAQSESHVDTRPSDTMRFRIELDRQHHMDIDSPRRSTTPLTARMSLDSVPDPPRSSKKRSASPSSVVERDRWGSSSPSRGSVSSRDSRTVRASIDSVPDRPLDSRPPTCRRSLDPHPNRHSTDHHPPAEQPRYKSSLSLLLDGDGQGGMSPCTPTATPSSAASAQSPPSGSSFAGSAAGPVPPPDLPHPILTSSGPRPTGKRSSISIAMAGMQLKSANTSRASSPGTMRTHAWSTFTASTESPAIPEGEVIGTRVMEHVGTNSRGPDVWRNETEADMRRREAEAEQRKRMKHTFRVADTEMASGDTREGAGAHKRHDAVGPTRQHEDVPGTPKGANLQRRKSEGPKRRRIGADDDAVRQPDVSIVEQIRRASGDNALKRTPSDETAPRRTAAVSRRASGHEAPVRRTSIEDTGRGFTSMPAATLPESQIKAQEASDQPETQSSDQMVIEPDHPQETPASGPVGSDGAQEGAATKDPSDRPGEPATVRKNSAEDCTRKNDVNDNKSGVSLEGPTPPTSTMFGHIWPPPVIPTLETRRGRKPKPDPEPTPPRSFITQRNLSVVSLPAEEDAKDGGTNPNKDNGSSLRTMLTTMPPRLAFVNAVQTFLTQPKHKGRVVVMTRALMKDALGVLLDPATDDMLKDYTPASPDEGKSSRDGTPSQGRKTAEAPDKAIDPSDHTTLEFRAWAKRMFSTSKTPRGEDVLVFGGKPVVVEDDIYETIVVCHSKGNHCSADETRRLVDEEHSWVPRVLVEAFVRECPGCPASNKVFTTTKPKKRKWVRREDKTGTGKRTTGTRRGKKTQSQEATKKRKPKDKEVSPANESEGDAGTEAELEGDREPEQEEDELGDDVEDEEMESEDEHVSARPAPSVVASSVPVSDKIEIDEL